MIPTPPPKRHWLDPPQWWRRWRPLRWGAGALLLGGVLAWFYPLLEARIPPAPLPPPAHVPDEADLRVDVPRQAVYSGADVEDAAVATDGDVASGALDHSYRAYLASPQDRVSLMLQFPSYSGVDAIFRALQKQGLEPEQHSFHSKVPPGVPPRELDSLRLSAYTHLGVSGSLELQFFNDRLYQAEFEPEDPERYRQALRRALPALKPQRSGRAELRQGSLRVASSLDLSLSEVGQALHTRPFVLWQDLRLVQQRDAWDREFAKKAAP